MRSRLATTVFVAAVAAATLRPFAPTARAGDGPGIEQQLSEWKAARTRPLSEKLSAARRLAGTRDSAALRELLAEFGRAAKHQDKFCELVAPSLADSFAAPEFAPILRDALLNSLNRPEDAWLAYQVAGAWMNAGRRDAAVGLYLLADKLPFHQAATLRALADAPDATARALAQDVLATLPDAEPQHTLLLEAAARVIEANVAPDAGDAALRAAVDPILAHLDEKQTTRRTATVLGRTLARIVKSDIVYADASSWRKFMDDRDAAEKLARDGYAPSRAYFAGVLLTGRDIVYVIDYSGSMSQPFTWRPRAPAETPGGGPISGPSTGKGGVDAERRRREDQARREQDVFRSLKALPWDKIHTRFDAVREALKASLRALEEDQRFAVVVFSSDARYLGSTPRLIQATHGNVEGTCSDIDHLRPDGDTNIHRALELAFGASRTKIEDPATGVGLDQILQGADTIVLLTDGAPTTDSYDVQGNSTLYTSNEGLLLAVKRWNLLFEAEVDCVGLADASSDLLTALAEQGKGKSRFLGK